MAVVEKIVTERNMKVLHISGKLNHQERDANIDKFRRSEAQVLLCTNVIARGIDVPQVDLVINFDIPKVKLFGFWEPDRENFLHRVGRTGRFGTEGTAITMVERDIDGIEMGIIE